MPSGSSGQGTHNDVEPNTNTAADILGIGRRRPARRTGLEMEVEFYLNHPETRSTPLLYWQEFRTTYPTIFRLAMDIIPIPGSAVPCERVFSSAKETMSPRRSRISAKLMEALQLLKFSIKQGRGLDFTAGLGWDAEAEELVALTEIREEVFENEADFAHNFTVELSGN